MASTRNPLLSRSRIIATAALLAALVVGAAAAQEATSRSTEDLKRDLKQTEQEINKIQDLSRKLASAGRESSNSKRLKLTEQLREHMGDCIIRREDDLGMEHTIKMHGQAVKGGTTDAAEVGAPVGTSRSKQVKNLAMNDGPNADRLRQLAALQSLYVSASKIERSAVEKQDEAFESYLEKVARFERELEAGRKALEAELTARQPAPAEEGEGSGGETPEDGGEG